MSVGGIHMISTVNAVDMCWSRDASPGRTSTSRRLHATLEQVRTSIPLLHAGCEVGDHHQSSSPTVPYLCFNPTARCSSPVCSCPIRGQHVCVTRKDSCLDLDKRPFSLIFLGNQRMRRTKLACSWFIDGPRSGANVASPHSLILCSDTIRLLGHLTVRTVQSDH